jgi:hypothetical protein
MNAGRLINRLESEPATPSHQVTNDPIAIWRGQDRRARWLFDNWTQPD